MQVPDIGYHAEIEGYFNNLMAKNTKEYLDAHQPAEGAKRTHIPEKEWRDMVVQAVQVVWYDMVTEDSIAAANRHAGIAAKQDGSENHLARVQLPSGEWIYPKFGGVEIKGSRAAQTGCGVEVTAMGAAVIKDEAPLGPKNGEVNAAAGLRVLCTQPSYERVFPTEKKKADTEKCATIKKSKEHLNDLMEEEELEEETPAPSFDRAQTELEATQKIGSPVKLQNICPARVDNLLGRWIVFYFDDGYDIGKIVKKVDPARHKDRYNYDVQYSMHPQRIGTVFHRLEPEHYARDGNFTDAEAGAWTLLEATAPLAADLGKRKRRSTGR